MSSWGGHVTFANLALARQGKASSSSLADLFALAIPFVLVTAPSARADEGGISVWLPGAFGSLAATPLQPGFSFTDFYVHSTASAGGNVAAARQATIGKFNPNVNINLNANINAK